MGRVEMPAIAYRPVKHPMSIRHRLGQLRWKLTLSYTLVTVGALLFVELVLLGGGAFLFDWLLVRSGLLAQISQQIARESYAPALHPYLAQSPPNAAGVDLWLQQFAEIGRAHV